MARKPTGNPVGPPKKKIDWQRFEDHCGFQCTQDEIASKLDIDRTTLIRRVKENYGEDYATVYKKYSAGGLGSLRSYQFSQARTSASMAIFLGKVLLGQKEDNREQIKNEVIMELFKSGKINEIKEYITQS